MALCSTKKCNANLAKATICRGDRRSVSTRPTGCVHAPYAPYQAARQSAKNVGATNLVARFPAKGRWIIALKRTDGTLFQPLPDKPCGQQNRPKYPPDSKKMTPFCLPNHNIHPSYVGATNLVARFQANGGWITALKRTNGTGNCRGDLSGRPPSSKAGWITALKRTKGTLIHHQPHNPQSNASRPTKTFVRLVSAS